MTTEDLNDFGKKVIGMLNAITGEDVPCRQKEAIEQLNREALATFGLSAIPWCDHCKGWHLGECGRQACGLTY